MATTTDMAMVTDILDMDIDTDLGIDIHITVVTI